MIQTDQFTQVKQVVSSMEQLGIRLKEYYFSKSDYWKESEEGKEYLRYLITFESLVCGPIYDILSIVDEFSEDEQFRNIVLGKQRKRPKSKEKEVQELFYELEENN